MKVAYLVNCYPRVSHTFIRREIAALELQGVEVERFSVRRTYETLVDEADQRELQRTRVILDVGIRGLLLALFASFALRPFTSFAALRLTLKVGLRSDRGLLRHVAYLAEAAVLRNWLLASGCRHVHAHFGTNSTTVAMLCHVLGGPAYSFTAHGPEEFDEPLTSGLSEKIEHASFVVAISSFGRAQLYRRCRYSHWPKVHVVHCALDEKLLTAMAAKVPERPRLVTVARLTAQKGLPLLIDAVARLVSEGVQIELVLVGDGELRPDVEAFIAHHNLGDKITITGWADSARVREELDAARFFVLPSFAEGLPVVIMEALAVGRPVLTTNIAGIPELVSSECGWLVPAGSVDALVATMRQALATPLEEIERMGKEGQRRVRERHAAAIEAQKLRLLFEQALTSQQP